MEHQGVGGRKIINLIKCNLWEYGTGEGAVLNYIRVNSTGRLNPLPL